MFEIGEYIVHGRNGVCRVEDVTHIDVSGADSDSLYYILVPMKSEGSKIFFPVNSDRVAARSIVTKEEAQNLVESISSIEPLKIENERQRENIYKEEIGSCDCIRLIRVIKTLYERNKERMEQGKKTTYVDDRYLQEAMNNLHDEFSIALGIEKKDVADYIIAYNK